MDKLSNSTFWFLALIAPLNGVIITVALLIVVDFITGSYVSYIKGIAIKSKRIGHTISKFFIYNLVIISAYFLEKHIVSEVPFLKIIAGFIAITEIKSILENYTKIYGVDPFKALVNFIKQTGLKSTIDQFSNEKHPQFKNTKKNEKR